MLRPGTFTGTRYPAELKTFVATPPRLPYEIRLRDRAFTMATSRFEIPVHILQGVFEQLDLNFIEHMHLHMKMMRRDDEWYPTVDTWTRMAGYSHWDRPRMHWYNDIGMSTKKMWDVLMLPDQNLDMASAHAHGRVLLMNALLSLTNQDQLIELCAPEVVAFTVKYPDAYRMMADVEEFNWIMLWRALLQVRTCRAVQSVRDRWNMQMWMYVLDNGNENAVLLLHAMNYPMTPELYAYQRERVERTGEERDRQLLQLLTALQ